MLSLCRIQISNKEGRSGVVLIAFLQLYLQDLHRQRNRTGETHLNIIYLYYFPQYCSGRDVSGLLLFNTTYVINKIAFASEKVIITIIIVIINARIFT